MGRHLNYRFARYVVTGGLSFFFEYAVFISAVYLFGLSPEIAQAVSYISALIINFLLLRNWTFKSKNGTKLRQHLTKYSVLIAFNLPSTIFLISWLAAMGLPAFLAKIAVVGIMVAWNYIVYDKLIFKQPLSSEDVI